MPKKTATDQPADPDKLIRQQPGTYRTADDRFEVREGATGWFLVDSAQTNEFGQELMRGPFGTLKAAREALPEARGAKPKLVVLPKTRKGGRSKGDKVEPEPPAPPPSWIDELPPREATAVRKLIAALEREGIGDGESLVRRDREGLSPAVAEALIERRLDALVEELPERGREGARMLVRRAAEVLTSGGIGPADPIPGWAVVEIGPEPEPPNRRISLGE